MSRDRSNKSRSRRQDCREERKTTVSRELMTFSFKDLDETQPKKACETIELWAKKGLLETLIKRIHHISKLTRAEACTQQQIKLYPEGFPPPSKTDFSVPSYVDKNVAWGVIEGMGGKPRVAGYLSENTFYVVFLDSEHKFYKSTLKHT
ncbi:hypothetical protein CGH72_25060 [Vibrio parahaemolyticus]|uniref:hypothetical protein n=4 Tax=Vibrio parahaemolyticus TaxID=670 RepID=UPI0004A144EF|nr:hypothetical protein [Vibrio parahaemolyticus]KCV75691.1 hypothetical protein Y011_04710 [Vibrio parahaemolyticus VP49]MBE3890001.1 hypothetical protein [Vibrio parahaemolyticus]MBO0166927.1 hypothetical protein [Vibrio parahaemolyticus]MDF4752424.1 hypothetical protein [Vibrio parahaemolyticus]MDF4779284.1 hypothetical protein [Vibrio parahaemolyticus]